MDKPACPPPEPLDIDSSESETDSNPSFDNFENPNFRKLYATLSVTTMMGCNQNANGLYMTDTGDGGDGFHPATKDNVVSSAEVKDEEREKQDFDDMPTGWEKHEDDNGPYYWHIPSGTIQRDKPTHSTTKRDSIIYYEEENDNYHDAADRPQSTRSMQRPVSQFLVHSLGWMEFDETQLTPQLSSKAIQRCIIELTTRGDNNAVRCWGKQETKQLILKIENSYLKLYDRIGTNTLLDLQPINGIRVWGVNDNNDFAYVAKDHVVTPLTVDITPTTPQILKCHVFHCEDENLEAAQQIATILRDEMIRIKMDAERSAMQQQPPFKQSSNKIPRPQHLYIEEFHTSTTTVISPNMEFPTPIEEPRKTIVAKYLGLTQVQKPTGLNVLNEAIDRVANSFAGHKNDEQLDEPLLESYQRNVISLVHISPSNIVVESTVNGDILLEVRVRYLAFLGISNKDVKKCGFIVQIGDNKFDAHVFECEPSSGALCKTVEAACKLRYQKCLDAHRQRCSSTDDDDGVGHPTKPASRNSSGTITSTIKNVFSKMLK